MEMIDTPTLTHLHNVISSPNSPKVIVHTSNISIYNNQNSFFGDWGTRDQAQPKIQAEKVKYIYIQKLIWIISAANKFWDYKTWFRISPSTGLHMSFKMRQLSKHITKWWHGTDNWIENKIHKFLWTHTKKKVLWLLLWQSSWTVQRTGEMREHVGSCEYTPKLLIFQIQWLI